MNEFRIKKATNKDLEPISILFDAYRVFYKQNSDPEAARTFITDRLKNKDSIIYLATNAKGEPMGFTQLYPIFSSVALKRVYVLNDLYVTAAARDSGIGTALLEQAKDLVRAEEARGLVLETDANNPAQKLYKKNGWTLDPALHFYWEV